MRIKEQKNFINKFYIKDVGSYLVAIMFGAGLGLMLCKLI